MQSIPPPPEAQVKAFLASTRFFDSLDDDALGEVAAGFQWFFLAGGTELCRRGEPSDGLYLVWRGRLVVVREARGGMGGVVEETIREVARGDSVGELAVLTGSPRSNSVRALRDSEVAKLPTAVAERLLTLHPGVALELARVVASWVHPNARPAADHRSTCFAVVSAREQGGTELAVFARRLATALGGRQDVALVDAERVDHELGAGTAEAPDDDPRCRRLPAWFHAIEADHRFVLYQAQGAGSAWIRRCLRQADRILVVVEAADEPGLGVLAPELQGVDRAGTAPREELILLHGAGVARPTGTARWLALRPFSAHHHLRPSRLGDVARLARALRGESVGVVLAGGGARGIAHIGVLRALEEAGVVIDRLGGSSMGAVMAALRARGHNWREMVELNRIAWVEIAPQRRVTLPLISILSARKVEEMLARLYGADLIEDLETNFFCVSTNLSRAELKVHREGPLSFAIGASMTIPGITPPKVAAGGELLVDGGVLNNLPADVMRRLAPGPIIAVDVSVPHDLLADPAFREAPSPWRMLRDKLRPGRKTPQFPHILQLLQRSARLASDLYARQSKGEVDLYIDLPMEGFEMFDMSALDRLVEHGYRATQGLLNDAPAKVWRRVSTRPRAGVDV